MRVSWTPEDGAQILVHLTGPRGLVSAWGLIDTGAQDLLLPRLLIAHLGLVPTGSTAEETAGGTIQAPTYAVQVTTADRALGSLPAVALAEGSGEKAILGRAVLRFFRVLFDGPSGSVTIA